MASTIITIRTDANLKRQAQKTAASLGLDLSTVIKRQLQEFVEKKEITYRKPLIPNKRTAASLRRAEEEHARGESYTFDSLEEALDSLKRVIRK